MSILKQSTAATIKLGPFVDDTDGKTAETGLTISQADIRLSKGGGDIAQSHNAAGATHDELGYYDVPLDTADTDTLGRLRVIVSESGALPVWQDFLVVTANVFDSLCSTDKLDCAVVEMATDVIAAAAVKADAVTKIQAGLALEATLTAMKGAGWTTETMVALDVLIDAIKAKTDLITTGTTVTVASQVSGSTITVQRGDTLSAALTNIGALTNYSKIWFTVKKDHEDTDATSLIQIEKTGGLLYINGAVATTAVNGSLTIDDEATGDVTIVLDEVESAKLPTGSYYYDIQILRSSGTAVSTLTSGTFIVSADVTRAVA